MHESTKRVKPRLRDQITGDLYYYRWMIRPLLLFVFLTALSITTWLLFSYLEKDSYLSEVNSAVIGSLATVIVAWFFAMVTFWSELRQNSEPRRLRRLQQVSQDCAAIKMGCLEIPGIAVVRCSRKGEEWFAYANMVWDEVAPARSLEKPVLTERDAAQEMILKEAAEKEITITNNEALDLVNVQISVEKLKDGSKFPHYFLTAAPMYYLDFISLSNRIDEPPAADPSDLVWDNGEPVIAGGSHDSLRSLWQIQFDDIASVNHLPVPAKLGCGTTLLTKDNKIVFTVRGNTWEAGNADPLDDKHRRKVHIVAAGMIPADTRQGKVDPRETSRRALLEELSIGAQSHGIGTVTEHKATGFFYDTVRLQPFFAYLAKADVDWHTLSTAASAEGWKGETLIATDFDLDNPELLAMLLDEHPLFKLATNHATAVLWACLMYSFGFDALRNSLSTPAILRDLERALPQRYGRLPQPEADASENDRE